MKPQIQTISTGDLSKVGDDDSPASGIPAEQDGSMPTRLLNDGIENATIESKTQLVEYLESGCKRRQEFRLGTEQEQFAYRGEEFSPAPYDDGRQHQDHHNHLDECEEQLSRKSHPRRQ